MSIKIIPVRFTENGFMTRPFALGGEGADGLDPAVKYRSCLQNWVHYHPIENYKACAGDRPDKG